MWQTSDLTRVARKNMTSKLLLQAMHHFRYSLNETKHTKSSKTAAKYLRRNIPDS